MINSSEKPVHPLYHHTQPMLTHVTECYCSPVGSIPCCTNGKSKCTASKREENVWGQDRWPISYCIVESSPSKYVFLCLVLGWVQGHSLASITNQLLCDSRDCTPSETHNGTEIEHQESEMTAWRMSRGIDGIGRRERSYHVEWTCGGSRVW